MKKDEFYEVQKNTIVQFYMNYRAFRFIQSKLERVNENKLFWISFNNNSLMLLFIYWSIIFGNSNTNELHWHNFCNEVEKNEFRNLLLKKLDMTYEDWKIYRTSMLNFRNRYVAHNDLSFNEPVPIIDNAFKSMKIYEEWIKNKIAENGIIYTDDLYKYIDDYEIQLKNVLSKLTSY